MEIQTQEQKTETQNQHSKADKENPNVDDKTETTTQKENLDEKSDKVKVLKTASNKEYTAPRQDHCFIYVIKKLRKIK